MTRKDAYLKVLEGNYVSARLGILAILEFLSDGEETFSTTYKTIAGMLNMTYDFVSKQLKIMKNLDIVEYDIYTRVGHKAGTHIFKIVHLDKEVQND